MKKFVPLVLMCLFGISAFAQQSLGDIAREERAKRAGTPVVRPDDGTTPKVDPGSATAPGQFEPLQLIKTVPLVYPAVAKARRLSGVVVVQVKVSKDGKVTNPQLIQGPVAFRDAAFEAVSQYQFRPAKLNGQAIEQSTQIKFNFHP